MRAAVLAVLVLVVLGAGLSVARAEPGAGSGSGSGSGSGGGGDATAPLVAGPTLHSHRRVPTHAGQFGLSLRFAEGLRGIVPYHSSDYCGATSTDSDNGYAALCTTRSPLALELELAYGVGRHFDVLVELKLGLEHDFGSSPQITDGPHPVALAPGIRYFFSESGSSKLFSTAQAVFDFTGYQDISGTSRGADFGVRNLNGIWFDVGPKVGIYLFAGETLTIARWLDFELEAGIGVQARYP